MYQPRLAKLREWRRIAELAHISSHDKRPILHLRKFYEQIYALLNTLLYMHWRAFQ